MQARKGPSGGSPAAAQEPQSGFKSCLYNLSAMLTLGLNFPMCNLGLIYFSTKRKIKGMEGGLGHMFPRPPS